MSVVESLRKVEFLKNVSAENLKELASISREVEFGPRQTIFREHDTARDVYLIVQGKVSVVICDANVGCRQIGEVGPGELLGWSPLLDQPRLSAAARTIDHVQAIAVDGDQLLKLSRQAPELGFEIMHAVADVLSQRLTATRRQLLDIGGRQLPEVQIESD